jgi:hypothetical protein
MKKLICITLLFLIYNQLSIAQDDSILVSTGTKDSIDMKYDRIYKLFIQDKSHDVRHIWSLGLSSPGILVCGIGYEQKIGKKWSNKTSLGIGADADLFNYNFTGISISIGDDIRYYYNLSRRENLGRNTNGFSGNYLSLGSNFGVGSIYFTENFNDNTSISHGSTVESALNFGYGLQRRIGNIGYFNASLGVSYILSYSGIFSGSEYYHSSLETYLFPFAGLGFGFAIESFKELKKMLK